MSTRHLNVALAETRQADIVTPESGAANFMKVIEAADAAIQSATADWLDLAIQMDPDQNGKTQVERRLEYKYANKCQAAHVALYGNRTLDQVASGEKVQSKTVDFCATNNLAYWEARWDAIKNQQIVIDEHADSYENRKRAERGEQLSVDDLTPEQLLCIARLEEARRNWAMCKAEYDGFTSIYEALTSVPYIYKPYPERAPVERPVSNNIALAAKLIKRS